MRFVSGKLLTLRCIDRRWFRGRGLETRSGYPRIPRDRGSPETRRFNFSGHHHIVYKPDTMK